MHILTRALAAVASTPPNYAHEACRIHTDSAASWSDYRWRNAYFHVADHPNSDFETHEYAYCSGGRGPWAWGASNVTVDQCRVKAAELNATCFDYMCQYHEAANCTCPPLPQPTPAANAIQVACVGDSITAGYLSSCGLNYPNQLRERLGPAFSVTNYGVGGQTMFKPSHLPPHDHSSYWSRPEYRAVLNSSADVIVLMLGTNDARSDRWNLSGGFAYTL